MLLQPVHGNLVAGMRVARSTNPCVAQVDQSDVLHSNAALYHLMDVEHGKCPSLNVYSLVPVWSLRGALFSSTYFFPVHLISYYNVQYPVDFHNTMSSMHQAIALVSPS